MIRALVFIAVVFAATLGVIWVAERPGSITIVWLDTEIRVSLVVAVGGLVAVLGGLWLVFAVFRGALRTPHAVTGYFAARRRDRGYQALSRGIIAIGAGDQKLAERYATESARLLYGEPLTVLLRAQAAQLGGDQEAARSAYQSMLADPETRLLGLHGLFVEAQRLEDHVAARHFAEGAVAIRPGIAWAGPALFSYQAVAGEWAAALTTLGANVANTLVPPRVGKRLEAVLRTARAGELEGAEPEVAQAMAVEAHRLAPDLVPAAVLAARLSVRLGDLRRATRILSATWHLAPHPDIALAFSDLRPTDAFRERAKRLRRLTVPDGQAVVAMTLARIAVDARAWADARAALAEIVAGGPTEAACLLMAEIEEGEHADLGRTRDWLARSLKAPRDPAWMADGEVFEAWAPVSPISGRVDAFEWRVPPARSIGNSGAFDAVLAGAPSGGSGREAEVTMDIEPRRSQPIVVPGSAPAAAVTVIAAAEPVTAEFAASPASAAGSPAIFQVEEAIAAGPLPAAAAPVAEAIAAGGSAAPPVKGPGAAPARLPVLEASRNRTTELTLFPPPPDDPGPGGEREDREDLPRLFGFLR